MGKLPNKVWLHEAPKNTSVWVKLEIKNFGKKPWILMTRETKGLDPPEVSIGFVPKNVEEVREIIKALREVEEHMSGLPSWEPDAWEALIEKYRE